MYSKRRKNTQIKTYKSFHSEHSLLYKDMLDLTLSINKTYPRYTAWYNNTFIPGLKKDERMYIVALDDQNILTGCIFAKNTPDEKKICTLFVNPLFKRQGIGKKLLETAIKELGELPLITVSSRNISQLKPLLDHFGFHLSATKKGIYGQNDTEFYFNDKKADLIQKGLLPILIQQMQHSR